LNPLASAVSPVIPNYKWNLSFNCLFDTPSSNWWPVDYSASSISLQLQDAKLLRDEDSGRVGPSFPHSIGYRGEHRLAQMSFASLLGIRSSYNVCAWDVLEVEAQLPLLTAIP